MTNRPRLSFAGVLQRMWISALLLVVATAGKSSASNNTNVNKLRFSTTVSYVFGLSPTTAVFRLDCDDGICQLIRSEFVKCRDGQDSTDIDSLSAWSTSKGDLTVTANGKRLSVKATTQNKTNTHEIEFSTAYTADQFGTSYSDFSGKITVILNDANGRKHSFPFEPLTKFTGRHFVYDPADLIGPCKKLVAATLMDPVGTPIELLGK